ncbi:hypothetical protein FQA39_LY00611 [Lamprigera yunnana]|nr:hypothetical protein FQA39_LY00611 [Lamprigera yunnana]
MYTKKTISRVKFNYCLRTIFGDITRNNPEEKQYLTPDKEKTITVSEERKHFKSLYSTVRKALKINDTKLNLRLNKIIEYNVLNRDHYVCFPIIVAYNFLTDAKNKEEAHLAHILDWCLDLLVGLYFMLDDIADKSDYRWGQKCWYRLEGNLALADAKMMDSLKYALLKQYFSKKPYYIRLINFHYQSIYLALLGQCMDLYSSNYYKKYRKLNYFTMDKYHLLARSKFYFFYCRLPIYSAFYITNTNFDYLQQQIDDIFQKMSYIQQAQNDMWDCFGNADKYGKNSSDISDGKFTWPIVEAIQHANPLQIKLLEENYGRNNPKSCTLVTDIYADLNIYEKYLTYKQSEIAEITKKIEEIPNARIRKVLYECIRCLKKVDSEIFD